MANVEFEETLGSMAPSRTFTAEDRAPGMAKFLIKTGVIKNSAQATYVLIGIILASLAISALFLYKAAAREEAPPPPFMVDRPARRR